MAWTDKTAMVICPVHGQKSLTESQYYAQLYTTYLNWKCPICFEDSDWSDESTLEDDRYEE